MQSLIVALVVTVCAVYAVWTLMPAAWRRGLARGLSRHPHLGRQAAVQRAARSASGACSCEGCDGAAPPPAVQTIQVIRRPR